MRKSTYVEEIGYYSIDTPLVGCL